LLTKKLRALRVNTCEIIMNEINLMLHAEMQKQNPATQADLYSTTPTTETCNYHPFSCLHQNSHISMLTPPSQPFPENYLETFLQYSLNIYNLTRRQFHFITGNQASSMSKGEIAPAITLSGSNLTDKHCSCYLNYFIEWIHIICYSSIKLIKWKTPYLYLSS